MKSGLRSAISTWLASLPAGEVLEPAPREQRVRVKPNARTVQPTRANVAVLTPRELDVLRQIAGGCTYAQAATRLGVSQHTIVTHVKNAYRKLDVHSAAAAVMRVVQLGLLCIDAPHKPAAPSPAGHALADLSDR